MRYEGFTQRMRDVRRRVAALWPRRAPRPDLRSIPGDAPETAGFALLTERQASRFVEAARAAPAPQGPREPPPEAQPAPQKVEIPCNSELKTAAPSAIRESAPRAGDGREVRLEEGIASMELLDELRSDVEGLYQRITGQTFPRERFAGAAAPLPPQIDPLTYLKQEVEQLKALLHQRLAPEAGGWTRRWVPVTDVFIESDRCTIRVELPGIAKEDVRISVGENVVRIEGDRRRQVPGGAQVLASERACGPFERWIAFPFPLDRSALRTRLEHGILEISAPRANHPAGNLHNVTLH